MPRKPRTEEQKLRRNAQSQLRRDSDPAYRNKCNEMCRNAYVAKTPEQKAARRKSMQAWEDANPASKCARNHRKRTRDFSLPTSAIVALFELHPSCVVCGSRDRLEVDHISPICRGGATAIENLQVLCMVCNRSKAKKTMEEWMATPAYAARLSVPA